MQYGTLNIDGKLYQTDSEGKVQTGFVLMNNGWHYVDKNTGAQAEGFTEIGGGRYWFSSAGVAAKGFFKVNGSWYYANDNCVLQTGWQTIGGAKYYFAPEGGAAAVGFYRIEDSLYYFNSNCVMQQGKLTINGKPYEIDNDGKVRTGFVLMSDGWHYIDIYSGIQPEGFTQVGSGLYWFGPTGVAAKGLFSVKGLFYYANENCVLQTGWQKISGNTYYFSQSEYHALTGLTQIDGYTYYFNEKGIQQFGWTYVASKQQYMNFGTNGIFTGEVRKEASCIDVSAYQGQIDWAKVKASGVDYAIIRAITWSNVSKTWVVDPFFESNVKGAKSQGIKVGAYIYTYAFNANEVAAEVSLFHSTASKLAAEGYKLDLPVFVDYEYNPILTAVPNIDDRTALLRLEMVMLEKHGYYPGMYMSTSWAKNNVNAAQLQREGYDLWIADYRGYNGWGDSVVMWQYSSVGTVPGIVGNVDMNYLYKDYSKLIDGGSSGEIPPAPERTLSVYNSAGELVTDKIVNILAAIVNNEVGGTKLTGKDRQSLFKAQAVAAHSWILYQYQNTGSSPVVGLKYNTNNAEIITAISDVVDTVVTYNGAVANTVYTSCNNGKTNSSADYWGVDLPYLRPVNSPGDPIYASNYQNKTIITSQARLQAELNTLLGESTSTATTPVNNWIEITSRNAMGYVNGIKICGRSVSVAAFCEKVYGPISPDFKVAYNGNSTWTFTSNGNGHAVGMSQYGAMWLIADASTLYPWNMVIQHYYPGTALSLIK